MAKSTARAAAVGAIVGLVYLLTTWTLSLWGVAALLAAVGLISAFLFARLYIREPQSLERFRWLCTYGLASVAALTLATLVGLSRLLAGIDRFTSLLILLVCTVVVMVGLTGFVIWHWIAVRNYSPRPPGHPDFEEDLAGNPVRRAESDRDG